MIEVDEGLIRKSQAGDRSAFESLLSVVYDLIYRFALSWCACVNDAEDVTQQACIKLAKVIRQFRFESAFTTWLYRLVVNCAHDWERKQRRHIHSELPQVSESDVSSSISAHTELSRVIKVVEAMGEGYKDVLLLVYAEGLNHREASEVLGVKEGTVSWRIHEIRKRLKLAVNEEAGL